MRTALLAAAVLSTALVVGCKDEPKMSPATTPSTSAPTMGEKMNSATQSMGEKAGEMKDKAGEMKDKAMDKAGDMKDKAMEKGGEMKDKAGDMLKGMKDKVNDVTTPSTPAPATPAPAVPEVPAAPATPAAPVDADAETKAKSLYEKGMEAVKEGKFDVASSAVDGLDKLKPSLSPEWGSKIDSLKGLVEKAKGLKIPSFGK